MPTNVDLSNMPAAQGSNGQPTTDAGAQTPPSNGAGSPPAATNAVDEAERQRRAAEGRRIKALEEQNAGLQNMLLAQQKQLADLGASLTAREEREIKAELDSLPPEDRLARQLELTEQKLSRRIDAMQSRATQPVAQEDAIAYQNRRMQEILDQVNAEFPGVDITPEDRDALVQRGAINLETPETYAHDLRLLAAAHMRGNPQSTPPQNGQTQGSVGGGQGGSMPNTDQNIDELVEQRAQQKADEYLRQFGINRPNSAHAAIPTGPATSESYQQLARNFGSNMAPRQRKAALQKLRDQR